MIQLQESNHLLNDTAEYLLNLPVVLDARLAVDLIDLVGVPVRDDPGHIAGGKLYVEPAGLEQDPRVHDVFDDVLRSEGIALLVDQDRVLGGGVDVGESDALVMKGQDREGQYSWALIMLPDGQ